MTDSTIDGKLLMFTDNWPAARLLHAVPPDGFNGKDHFNVDFPAYPIGTKVTVYHDNALNKGRAGWATFIYLRLGTANATTDLAAKSLVVPENGATLTADTHGQYRVTNDSDAPSIGPTGSPMVAVAIGAMTDLNYGFFFCGGILPAETVQSAGTYCLDTTFKTIGNVRAGAIMVAGSNSGCIKLAHLGDQISTSLDIGIVSPCGFSWGADT